MGGETSDYLKPDIKKKLGGDFVFCLTCLEKGEGDGYCKANRVVDGWSILEYYNLCNNIERAWRRGKTNCGLES
ncbi:MAG: hypothetical protein JETCAE04_31490 [Candidatus Jettenia caeni]|nr:MAG: hypothetical protein JETCAE04_31490 [Candidatus Jettenia caeni]